MAYYRTCPLCKAHLDPGEICDCRQETKKEAAPDVAGTTSGIKPMIISLSIDDGKVKAKGGSGYAYGVT